MKKVYNKYAKIELPPYKCHLIFIVGDEKYQGQIQKRVIVVNKIDTFSMSDVSGCVTPWIIKGGGKANVSMQEISLIMPVFDLKDDFYIGVLVHESVHVAKNVFKYRDITFDPDNDEPFAYLTDHIFRKCLECVRKWDKRK